LTVQDDERERELVRLFNLDWDPAHQRAGVDATLSVHMDGREVGVDVEVKSTTGATVSTARDVGMEHVAKWRHKMFVVGFYSRDARRPELQTSLCLTPTDMKPWIDTIEAKVALDDRIARRASAGLLVDDVVDVCGAKPSYSIDDARAVLRQQWSAEQYEACADLAPAVGPKAFSAAAMLIVLKARALYIARRGSTLNNPHITSRHLAPFFGTDSEVRADWAARIRAIARQWLAAGPAS
jgi:hypothetical protein